MSTAASDAETPDSHRTLAPGPAERWRPASGTPDPALVLRLAGHRRPATVPPQVAQAARRMAERAGALAHPEAWWRAVPVAPMAATTNPGPPCVELESEIRFSGRAIAVHLAGCRLAVAFVLTIGGALEGEATKLEEAREPLDAYLLDRAGWALIETTVRGLRLHLRARARQDGHRLTHRLAPGYADWPLEEQPGLLALLAAPHLPVRLNDHGVLVPFKSVTGLFGVRTG